MAGLTQAGFIAETFQSIREQIQARLRSEFGAGLPLDESTIEGQSWDILIEALVKVWELMELLYSSMDPDKAVDAALDALCLLTGTFRKSPSFGVGFVILTGDPATSVPAGSDVRIGSDGAIAVTTAGGSIAAASAYVALASYEIGDVVVSAGNIYCAITAGVAASVTPVHTVRPISMAAPAIITNDGGLTTTDTTDGDIVWIWVGAGTGAAVDVAAVAVETGPVNYPSFSIDQIVTPSAGWSGVGNALDFTIGRNLESNESLRESRNANLAAPGTSTQDAIRAALLECDADIVSVTMFVNRSSVTDADGVPPHAIEALVRGGADQTIFDCLLANVAMGIETYGNTTGIAIDSEGTAHVVSFSRPEEIDVYVAIVLTKDPATYPTDGNDQVAAAIVTFGDAQNTGKDAVAWSIGAQSRDVDGVLEVTACNISTAPAPTLPTTITITKRQLAVFDTSRIGVTSSDATP